MSEKLKFIWIDDDPKRERAAHNMSHELGVDITFKGIKGKNVERVLKSILAGQEPDLVLMDHSFHQADGDPIRTGSSAAAIIREKWPSCPIVSVTAIEKTNMDTRHRSAYEAIFPFDRISENYSKLVAIAEGFKALKEKIPNTTDDILEHLKVPEDECDKMVKIFPRELKENFEDKSLLLEIYRWCDSILFKRPGFLYDRLWVSTLLGLNSEGFQQVEAKFESAKYQGVFANNSNERWWKSEVLSILGGEVDQVGLPWELGRALVDDNNAYFSKCHVSEEEFPETVAFVDANNDAERHPMKLKYTEPHPNFEDMLFFEELRKMTPEK